VGLLGAAFLNNLLSTTPQDFFTRTIFDDLPAVLRILSSNSLTSSPNPRANWPPQVRTILTAITLTALAGVPGDTFSGGDVAFGSW